MPEGPAPAVDEAVWAYVAVFLIYVALGLLFQSIVLNWIVGPLFLLVSLHVIPHALGRSR